MNDNNYNKLDESFIEYEFDVTKTNENATYSDSYIRRIELFHDR